MNFKIEKIPADVRICEKFGNAEITVNNRYLTKNGKPWLPVMAECHYSRIPREKWEETLRKMKDGGAEIAASYVFWIHHEEEKGIFDFTGNRDIRHFIELCHKVGLEFCLRIGPWAHGECRNGGFPDWLCEECASTLRSDKEPYFGYVRRYLRAVADQVRGLPLFGIQIENEMTWRPEYMELVRQAVLETGLTAPLLTATGWGNARLPDTLLPMFGGYPEAPWTGHTHELEPNANYFFSYVREDGNIGADLLGISEDSRRNVSPEYPFPFMTCELGGGNQVTYHRRPRISSRDIEALAVCKLGSGANLLGYYMYTGGLNPVGKTTMQESKESGYPNDCPVISYDFQSPIGDMGQLRESWFRLSKIHTFVRSFGEMLAPMEPVMPSEMPASLNDTETLRCAFRTDGKGGFLFVNNHIRLHELPVHPKHRFAFDFADESVAFDLDIPADSTFFLPVNLTLAGLSFRYASAQPVSYTENELTLMRIPGIDPVMVLRDGRTVSLKEGVSRIGDTDVVLLPYEEYVPDELTRISAEPVPKCCDASILLGHLPVQDHTSEYAVRWTAEDRWMVIRARGNLAGFYACAEGRLISDFYLYGDAWVIDLRNLAAKEGIIKIQPLSEEDRNKIYLEIPFETGVYPPEVWVSRTENLKI
jgi:hypothetical protein